MEPMRRTTEGSVKLISQNPGVVYGVPSTPQPARLASVLINPSSLFFGCHLEGQTSGDPCKKKKKTIT